jgi:hypothetical protein
MQWADKQRCYATSLQATAEMFLEYKSGNGVFYVVRAEML